MFFYTTSIERILRGYIYCVGTIVILNVELHYLYMVAAVALAKWRAKIAFAVLMVVVGGLRQFCFSPAIERIGTIATRHKIKR